MKNLNPYLFFDGKCQQAMKFYQTQLGGDLEITTYGEAQEGCPEAMRDKVMHAQLNAGQSRLMASDSPSNPATTGKNIQIALHCESREEIERLFKGMGEGGKITHELEDVPWNAVFGVLQDQFGMSWMLN